MRNICSFMLPVMMDVMESSTLDFYIPPMSRLWKSCVQSLGSSCDQALNVLGPGSEIILSLGSRNILCLGSGNNMSFLALQHYHPIKWTKVYQKIVCMKVRAAEFAWYPVRRCILVHVWMKISPNQGIVHHIQKQLYQKQLLCIQPVSRLCKQPVSRLCI